MHFEKQRAAHDRLDSEHCGIETLDVTDLKNPAVFSCRAKQRIGFVETRSHRFFDQCIESHLEQAATHFGMRGSGHGHTDRVDSSA